MLGCHYCACVCVCVCGKSVFISLPLAVGLCWHNIVKGNEKDLGTAFGPLCVECHRPGKQWSLRRERLDLGKPARSPAELFIWSYNPIFYGHGYSGWRVLWDFPGSHLTCSPRVFEKVAAVILTLGVTPSPDTWLPTTGHLTRCVTLWTAVWGKVPTCGHLCVCVCLCRGSGSRLGGSSVCVSC